MLICEFRAHVSVFLADSSVLSCSPSAKSPKNPGVLICDCPLVNLRKCCVALSMYAKHRSAAPFDSIPCTVRVPVDLPLISALYQVDVCSTQAVL